MALLAIGTKINISPQSKFKSQGKNHDGTLMVGIITSYWSTDAFVYEVKWNNGNKNLYDDIDLLVIGNNEPIYEIY